MENPAFYSAIDAAGAVVSSSALLTSYEFSNISDNQSLFGSLYLGPEYESYTITCTGTDGDLIRVDQIPGNKEFVLSLKNTLADHRTKTSYAFNVVATGESIETLSVTCVVTATILPSVTEATILVQNGNKGVVHTFTADEPCTFAFDAQGTSDNSAFTLSGTNNAVLSLITRSSFNTKSSYTVMVIATSVYNTSLNSPSKSLIVNVTNGVPLFLTESDGNLQSGNYVFSVADGITTLLGVNYDSKIYSSDTCTYILSGTDASLFSVAPISDETSSKFATLSLLSAARKQDKPSYSLSITANNGAFTSTNAIIVTVGPDTTLPVLTGSSANSTTYTVATGLNTDTNPDIVTLNAPWINSLDIFNMLSDESVIFALSGSNSSLFKLSTVENVNTNTVRPNSRKVGVSFINNVPGTTKENYTIQVIATDPAENVISKYVKVMISDVTRPTITLTPVTQFITKNSVKYTNATVVEVNFTTSEKLSVPFLLSNFAVTGENSTITAFNLTTTKARVSVKIDSSIEDQDITLKLKANTVKDANNELFNDEISFTFRYARTLNSIYEIKLLGSSPLTIPQGRFYTDAGFLWNGLSSQVLTTESSVDVKTAGTYTVRHKASVQGIPYEAIRTVIVSSSHAEARPKPAIVVTGGTTTISQVLPKTTGIYIDNATVTPITNSVGIPITATSTNNVDTSVAGSYTVTYTAGNDDVYGPILAVTRSLIVTHPAQVITLEPKPGFTAIKLVFEPDEAFVNSADANKIYNKNGEELMVTAVLTVNSIKYPPTATVTFNAIDDGVALQQVTLNLSVLQPTTNVDFILSGIKPTFTFSTVLNLNTATGPAPEDDLTKFPGLKILTSLLDFNTLFYIKPEVDVTIELQPLEVFMEHSMEYKINPDAFVAILNLDTLLVTENIEDRFYNGTVLTGNVANSSDQNQIISKIVIANAIQDMFKTSRLEDVISTASKNSMRAEINTILTTTVNTEIKKALSDNSSKTNNDKGKSNLVRQLIGQLHSKILDTTKEDRLTTSNNGMFHLSNKVLTGPYANYYPFKFEAGDTLTISVKFMHPHAEAYQATTVVAQPRDTEISVKFVLYE